MKRALLPLALCGALAWLGACGRPGLAAGQGRLEVNGRAELTSGARALRLGSGTRLVHRGDRIQIDEGSAHLALAGGSALDLRQGSGVRVDGTPQLLGGEAVATAAGRAFTVDLGSAQAQVGARGAAHLSRGLAATAGAYRRDVVLRSAGREIDVRTLRQASSPALGLVEDQIPLQLHPSDPWDRRFLGEAIDVGQQLQSLVRPFDALLGAGEGRTPGFFRVALPALEREQAFDGSRLDAQRPPGETLIGAAIAVSSQNLSFGDRWSSIFAFRDQGAEWGLVALDQGVANLPGVVDLVNAAFGRLPLAFPGPSAAGPGGQLALGAGPGATALGGGGAAPAGGAGTSPGEGQGSNPGSGGAPPGPVPQPPQTGTPADQIIQPVLTPVVNEVNSVLQPVVGGGSPAPAPSGPALPSPGLPVAGLAGGAAGTLAPSTTTTIPLPLPAP
ncbi:MAG: hypothetical protein E6G27_16770 [Actinobacteria bacterium]|nr:MAG: hypothetical protein E6G27_16770 [Actinomycetota bacterium]